MNTPGPILLFDGVCNLCNGLVNLIIIKDHDARIKFAPLQSHAGQSLLKQFDLNADDIDSVVCIAGNRHFLRSSAVLHVFKELGSGWRLLYGFIIIPGFIRDFFYNMIAGSRYKIFGKTDYCMVPTPGIKERFL